MQGLNRPKSASVTSHLTLRLQIVQALGREQRSLFVQPEYPTANPEVASDAHK